MSMSGPNSSMMWVDWQLLGDVSKKRKKAAIAAQCCYGKRKFEKP